MIEVRQSQKFIDWLRGLRDDRARGRILQRITRLQRGNFGDVKFFDGIGELRIDYGPGNRVYFVRRGPEIVVLLCGGDKSSQQRDIEQAKKLGVEQED